MSVLNIILFLKIFTTILNSMPVEETTAADNFDNIFNHARGWYGEEEFAGEGKIFYQPPALEDVWLPGKEQQFKKLNGRQHKDADQACKDAL